MLDLETISFGNDSEISDDASSTKTPLREEVMQTLLNKIISGELEPGAKLTESKLAEELGVSRTPVREALFYLERDGFVKNDLAKGFSVSQLSAREVRESFPILESLEVLALRSLGPFAAANVNELKRLNQAFSKAAGNSNECIAIDNLWHETLLGRCPNQRLLALIKNLKHAIMRYEHLYMIDASLVAMSVSQHAAVIKQLEAGNMDAAVAALETNWRFSRDAMLVRIGETSY